MKSVLVHVIAHELDDLVTQHHVARHPFAAQVEVAVSQADILVLVLVAADHDGRGFRLVQHDHFLRFDFDLAGRHPGIELVGRAHLHRTCDLQHPFSPRLADDLVRLGEGVRVRYHLRDPITIPQDEEDHAAECADVVNPAREGRFLTRVGGPQFTTSVSFIHGAPPKNVLPQRNEESLKGYRVKPLSFLCG
jgi:hypothetical protein